MFPFPIFPPRTAVAWSFVAAGAATQSGTPALPAGWAQGDLLLIAAVTSTSDFGTPAGYTQLGDGNGGDGIIRLYYKIAGASESNPTLSGGNAQAVTAMLAYRNISSTPFDAASLINESASNRTTVPTNTLVTTADGDLVVSVYWSDNNSAQTWTAPASTTARVNSGPQAISGNSAGLLFVDENQAASGTSTSRTATLSGSMKLASMAFSFKNT